MNPEKPKESDFNLQEAAEDFASMAGLTGRIKAHAVAKLKRDFRAKNQARTETKATARRRRQIERGILKTTGGEE